MLSLTPPNVAEIDVVPTFFAVASPLTVTEAMVVVDDFHVAVFVTS